MATLRFLLLAAPAITTVSAHMNMIQPPLFGEVNNSPLNNAKENPGVASNYPCKATGPGYYDWSKSTTIGQGQSYDVQFKGQAVHGGGSCQFSLSKDTAPTAQSEFKVIHSVEGGCPMRNTPGNAGDDANAIDPDKYTFIMNPKVAPGNYTFAWTWFNKVGNREMYMNCAPVTVTPSAAPHKAKRDVDYQDWDQLPNMLVANNAAGPNCQTNSLEWSVKFPDPGNDVEINPDTFIYPNNYCEAPNFTPMQVPASLAASASSSFTMAATGAAAPTNAPAGSASPAPSATPTPAAPIQSSAAPAQAPAAAQTPAAAPATAPVASGPGSCLAGQQPCSAPSGNVFCFSATQWGLCNNGCAVPQAVAAGTTCAGGAITKRSEYMKSHSRVMRHKHRGEHVVRGD